MRTRHALPLLLLILTTALFAMQTGRPVTGSGCLACHADEGDIGPAHPPSVLGCSACHLGNRFAADKDRAHASIVRDPGDLRVAARTCGRTGCHPEHLTRVLGSVMTTNSGIRAALTKSLGEPLGRDLYAKLCASCHFGRPRGAGDDEFSLRGGGCSGCHVTQRPRGESGTDKTPDRAHARLSMRVTTKTCVRCHNRSARIGLSYLGRYESEGYGTPLARGEPARALSGGRHYLELAADVHHAKAGMDCIDCHTGREVMGHGTRHPNMADQVEITCEACHCASFSRKDNVRSEASRLATLSRTVPVPKSQDVAVTGGTVLYNVQKLPEKAEQPVRLAVLYRKRDGKPIPFAAEREPAPHHALSGHERLSCQACHSRFMPQCVGCHMRRHAHESQYDKLARASTPGRWEEGRYYMRFESPVLGITKKADGRETIMPCTPCQVLYEVETLAGTRRKLVSRLSMFDPHSTQHEPRPCRDCHASPSAVNRQRTLPLVPNQAQELGLFPVERFPARPAGSASSDTPRPFTTNETASVLGVAPCLGCHKEYGDPVFKHFSLATRQLRNGTAHGCPANRLIRE